jgi:hypothetical protein
VTILSPLATQIASTRSETNGSILRELGGKRSDFVKAGFNYSAQHDARLRGEKDSITIFFNNTAGTTQRLKTSTHPYALIIALDTSASPAAATLVKQYPWPDVRRSYRYGNTQILPNTNVFTGWTSNGCPSEFPADGRLVLEVWPTPVAQ